MARRSGFGSLGRRPTEEPVIRDEDRGWLMRWRDFGNKYTPPWSIVWEGAPERASEVAETLRARGFSVKVGAGHFFWPPFTSPGKVVGVRHRLLPWARDCLAQYGVPEGEVGDFGAFASPANGWKFLLLLAVPTLVLLAFLLLALTR